MASREIYSNGDEFLDVCEAYGRSGGVQAAAVSCETVKNVCLPSRISPRSVFLDNPSLNDVVIEVLFDSCEELYKTSCKQSAFQAVRTIPDCAAILTGRSFLSSYCPDVETAMDIFEDGLVDCETMPPEVFAALGKQHNHAVKIRREQQASAKTWTPSGLEIPYFNSPVGRTLQSLATRQPAVSGVPDDPCDCTQSSTLAGGHQVDMIGCNHFCYVVGGENCTFAFPSAKFAGTYIRLCS